MRDDAAIQSGTYTTAAIPDRQSSADIDDVRIAAGADARGIEESFRYRCKAVIAMTKARPSASRIVTMLPAYMRRNVFD